MGEFVESSLEGLLPVFEQLRSVQLLSPEEVVGLVKRCRRYEYRLQKLSKTPDDFLTYGDYLNDVIVLIRSRRARQDYWHKNALIEKPLALKIASVYQRCCNRFQVSQQSDFIFEIQGNFDLWRKLFNFLDSRRLRKQLSKAYTRALQIHGRNVDLRVESALWEFFQNASADNARAQLQLAIRMDPAEHRYYEALFKVEVHYVEKIMQRRSFLQKTVQKIREVKHNEDDGESDVDDSVFDVDVNDSVLQLYVAEVVLKAALDKILEEKRGEMLINMWMSLKDLKFVQPDALARLRNNLESKIQELANEYTQLFIIKQAVLNNEDEFYAYEKALDDLPTEKMHRIFLEYCENKLVLSKDDPLLEMKKAELLAKMLDNGWVTENDVASIVQEVVQGDKKGLLEKALKSNPSSVVFWTEWLQYQMDNESFETTEEIQELLNQLNNAFDKVPSHECFPLWEFAIEFAITYTPNQVDEVFTKAFKTADPVIASRVKITRLSYLTALLSEEKISLSEMHTQIKDMINQKPNDSSFYLAVAEQELAHKECNHELVKLAYNSSVCENGTKDVASWIEFIRYSMKYDPKAVGKLHQRAMTMLEHSLCAEFVESWTILQQEESEIVLYKEKQSMKRNLEDKHLDVNKKKNKNC